jgi:hypothetical protein
MKSLLFQNPLPPFTQPPGCEPGCGEQSISIKKNGKLYKLVVRTKTGIEFPYLTMLRAYAHSLQASEPYAGTTPGRDLRDALIKTNLVV